MDLPMLFTLGVTATLSYALGYVTGFRRALHKLPLMRRRDG